MGQVLDEVQETPDLRARVIERLKLPGALNMGNWGWENYIDHACGTACCLSGLIHYAAADLGLRSPIRIGHEFFQDYKARELWAKAYGADEAEKLDFMGNFARTPEGEMCSLRNITPEQVIAHLEDIRGL